MSDVPVIAEYVWIGANDKLRSKVKTLYREKEDESKNVTLSSFPDWNFDGSSTGQAEGTNSEVIIRPCAMFDHPLEGPVHYLVLCDCYNPDMTPHQTNTRAPADQIFETYSDEKPWYGLEQEYFIVDPEKGCMLGGPHTKEQGDYYCGVGADNAFGREIAEDHYQACLVAGIKISGINGEVAPGQWEFQVGPSEGISAGDQLWMARYLLHRIAEKHGVVITFDPKPLKGDWNGSGLHTNFSTERMRGERGIDHILGAMDRLAPKHLEHLAVYGTNDERLTGLYETSSPDRFTYGVASRAASVRIPREVSSTGKGYFEDRRPASDADPYQITSIILETVCKNDS